MLLEVTAGIAAVGFLWFLAKKDPEPLLGVYSQPGKWFLLKKYAFMLMLILRKYQAKKKKLVDAEKPGYGQKSRSSIDEMERPQSLCSDKLAIDCMYFNGLDAAGNYVILRIARRHGRKAEIWLSINVPGLGFFQSPVHPDTTVYNVDSDTYSAGGLKFECVEPMRQWRVTFNGLLRKGMSSEWCPEKVETVHAQMSLTWCAFTDSFDFDTDVHPSCLAESIAREKWSRDFFDRLRKSHQTHYEQWGEMWGTFCVEGHPEHLLRLRGYRDHSYGVRDWYSFHRYAINFAYLEDGSVFHVNSVSMPGSLSLLQCGYMSYPNATMVPVSWTDMNMLDLGEDGTPPKQYEFNYKADGKDYHVRVLPHTVFLYFHHEDWRSVIFEQVSSFEVNGVKGYGIFEFLYRRKRESPITPQESYPLLKELQPSQDHEQALALTFTQPSCTSSRLVGGKGCQLALLTQLKSQKFAVPNGFCLTIKAFESHFTSNKHLQQLLNELHDVSCTKPNKLPSVCSTVVKDFQSIPLCSDVRNCIAQYLEQVFGNNYSSVSLAVRSSATGEDGTEMSAAGQMETVLGVRGLNEVCDAVLKCWASQFALPAVSYRRQHGQSIKLSAGVVIQQMVPAAAAGVLFTCHPVTGNPGLMILNANYGLGESVVSGESQPDEITINRSWDDKLTIVSKTVGAKKIQIKLTSDGGTQEVTGNEGDTKVCCLSNDVILKLAAIGIELEKRFANPRDIEFAVDSSGTIHLLQARPITTLDHVSEYELLTEFNTAYANDHEYVTSANIQEMMPGAMTPLTLSTFHRAVEQCGQVDMVESGTQPYLHQLVKFTPVAYNQGFINLSVVSGKCELHSSVGDLRMLQLALLGEVSDHFTLRDVELYNGRLPAYKRHINALRFIKRFLSSDSFTKYWTDRLKSDLVGSADANSLNEMYDRITETLPQLSEVFVYHFLQSSVSAVWSNVMMAVLTKNQPEWNPEHFSDLALLLSKCEDVYSADVPAALQRMAAAVIESGSKDKFVGLSPEDAVQWLQSSESEKVGVVFAEFLERHGHRCIREAELREKSWQRDPIKFVKVLQVLVKTPQQKTERDNLSHGQLISRIKTPTTFVARALLRWILPKAQKSVGEREYSKSLSIKLINYLKNAYERLAEMMVNESRLPDTDLIFFFTHREIGELLRTRSGSLITRAQRRRQLLPKMMSLRFPRIFFGHPQPIEESTGEDPSHLGSSVKLMGCPVSLGEVCGKARVVTSIDAAAEIQLGEILIVPYTDVGWSPYFPMISGLVTEIGGLLSHGAVVAREYGLPCVVNVQKATVIFKTGDTVRLNGGTGCLEKLSVDDSASQ